jgi:hypothetical protein
MGTNYYLVSKPPLASWHLSKKIHLGKSVPGWTFALHVVPECGINDLPEMITWLERRIKTNRSKIVDEHNKEFTLLQFLEVVTKRSHPERIKKGWDNGWWAIQPAPLRFCRYTSEDKFHKINCSQRGPSGLLRRQVDGTVCIGHGAGTWDLCAGKFS